MSRSLSSPKFNLKLSATVTNTLTDATGVTATQPSLNYVPVLTDGIEANQANRGWQGASRTILSGHQEIIDLDSFIDIGAGVGNDAVGLALTLEEIVALVVVNENAVGVAGQLEIAPSNSEGWTPIGSHTVANGGALRGQGMLCMVQLAADGFDVDPASSHRITFKATGGNVTYGMYILGRHDDEESSSSSLSSSSPSSLSSLSSSSSSSSSISSSTSSLSISTSSVSSLSSSSRSSVSSQSSVSSNSSSQSSVSSNSSSESSSSLSS